MSSPRHIGHRDEREAPRRAPKARPEPAEGLHEATFQADACDWTRPFTMWGIPVMFVGL